MEGNLVVGTRVGMPVEETAVEGILEKGPGESAEGEETEAEKQSGGDTSTNCDYQGRA